MTGRTRKPDRPGTAPAGTSPESTAPAAPPQLPTATHRRRVGLLGGTFDPIHYGHLRLAESLAAIFNFDELLFIPTYSPPHKDFDRVTSAYHRYAMTVLATLQMDIARVSMVEIFAPERPYTADTVATLRRTYGDETHLFFMMGADSFASLPKWERYQTLLDSCHLIVMTRPKYEVGDLATLAGQYGAGRVIDLRADGPASGPSRATWAKPACTFS
ncbi:nicotinate (nicotinamide) nucleotide adenylyltransferase [Chloracidobacterium aggregatum]|uniref:nicotinate (nicotinamide) nucleotide adenylyltransferase n=1 Tax=Chloracidobacterium aggregatum TaxID=2851959 RepID=UPI001B8D41B7|nr:nicotinate (nicotinamide) nucleotide adenylyltransferase [Chloracidobacterium aggregatum]QUV90985.1 nicotinate (nicotinamide) nucleotide adenylyltransferase [Chloracidobacterium sp. A]